jgi:ABC-type transport system involved in multi-copper enzyme maturation permease subunit
MNGADGQALPRLSAADYFVQTWGVLVAAYRELNARKLFWVALVLNGLVIAAMAAVGVDEKGVSVFGFDLPIPLVNTTTYPDGKLYKFIFVGLGVGVWLAWLSTILALLSTASMFPDLASGGVDTMLSKPIGRTRLFVTKFVSGLLFTALQVTVFALLGFLVIGIRGGSWEWGLFVVVPLMVVFFSYLFSVQAVVGMITRSPIASVIVTLLFWIFVFLVDAGERFTMVGVISARLEIAGIEARMEKVEDEERKSGFTKRRDDRLETLPNWELAHDIFYAVKTALPKTSETAGLTTRALALTTEMPVDEEEQQVDEQERRRRGLFRSEFVSPRKFEAAINQEYESRNVWWVVGTSLGFVGVMLGVGVWYFRRRDF